MSIMIMINQVVILFLLMAVGVGCAKTGIITEEGKKALSSLIIKIGLPGLVFSSILGGIRAEIEVVVSVILLSFFNYFLMWIISVVLNRFRKIPNNKKGVYTFMYMFGNSTFMGIPVITALYGEQGTFYASLCIIPFCLLTYSVGIYQITSCREEKKKVNVLKSLLENAAFVSVIVSMGLYFTDVKIPTTLITVTTYLGNLCTPISMIIIGVTLVTMSPKKVFLNLNLWIMCITRLVLAPICVMFALRLLSDDAMLISVLTVICAMPVAANTTMLCIEYDGDSTLAAEGVFMSTVLSIITLPIVAMFI